MAATVPAAPPLALAPAEPQQQPNPPARRYKASGRAMKISTRYERPDLSTLQAPWWRSYLASTLTGWTLNAVSSCYCDICKCHFSSTLSVLQHLRDSYKHLATVEALEAKGALYVYDCAQVIQYNYGGTDFYDQGAYSQDVNDALIPSIDPAEAGLKLDGDQHATSVNGSTSPTNAVEPPASEIFTASSEVSDEQPQPEDLPQQHRQQRIRGKQFQRHLGGAAPTARGNRSQRRGAETAGTPQPRSVQPSVPKETYNAAFPSLGGATATVIPVRKWTPAASTRKLRVDAPEWAPGCPVSDYVMLSFKARQAASAPEATTEAAKTDDGAASKAGESPVTSSSDVMPPSQPQTQNHKHSNKQRQHHAKMQKQEQELELKKTDQKEAAGDAAAETKPIAAMSWRSIVARPPPAAVPAAPATTAAPAAATLTTAAPTITSATTPDAISAIESSS